MSAAVAARRTFVLVPGAYHGGWCFRRVAEQLRSRGHTVHSLTLTGLGDRAHLADRVIDVDLHVSDVASVLDAEELEDVVLVGHSYGGFVIRGVAERRASKLRALVYLDALVPVDGETLLDHLGADFAAKIREGGRLHGDRYLVPVPPAEFFGLGPEHASWVMRHLTPQPFSTGTQPMHLADDDPRIARSYIHCDSPCMEHTVRSKTRVRGEPGWTHRTLPTGHESFVTMPGALTHVLEELAELP